MSRYRRVALGVLAAAAVLAGAWGPCSSDDKNKLTDEEFLFAAQAAANASLLTLDDIPADGWRTEPDEPDDSEDEADRESGFTGDCVAFEEAEDIDGWPGQTAFANGDAVIGPTHEINTDASVFRDEGEAEKILSKYFPLYETCRDQIIAFIRSDPETGPNDTFEFALIEGLDLGDEAYGVRIEFGDEESSGVVDFLSIRQGRMIVSFIWGGGEADDTNRDIYAAIHLEKVRAAEKTLPD